ncbi:nuclear GTPase SLIP-GC [Crotalus adamanteus]|uniref:Nuclear GTPase SLIP-GC n=1 Tax=Crotalus adamanteus TaxID=8729 RepID=A0AAW1BLG9_CROAD
MWPSPYFLKVGPLWSQASSRPQTLPLCQEGQVGRSLQEASRCPREAVWAGRGSLRSRVASTQQGRGASSRTAGRNCCSGCPSGSLLLFVDSTGLPGRGQSGKKGESPEMALPCLLSGEGPQLSHLRSIGPWAPTPGSCEIVHFDKAVTLFGRNQQVVDYCLNSPAATPTDLKYISRIHARIIRTDGAYILVDSSLTGVYVNDIRIEGRVILREGDTVTFGHPAGKNLLLGSHTRQPNSPFYFLFEHCNCCPDQMQSVYAERRNFSQLLKRPDMVSAGVSHPGNPNLAFVHHIPRPQMALPGVLPGQASLLNSVTQRDHHTTLAPPPTPVLSASSPMTAPLSTSSQDSTLGGPETSDQTGFPSSSALPLSSPCGPASQVLRSASPDYTLPKDNSFAAPEFSPLQENSESSESVSLSSSSCSESAVEYDTPNAQQLFQHKDARSDPGRACMPLLFPGPTCSEVSVAADHDGSPKPVEASGPWEETFTPVFPTETGGASGCASSVFSPESPAPSETVQDEELAEMNLCPTSEDVEMEPPTDAGLEGVDGHLHGREHEPEIPGDAGGTCSKASVVDICAEMGLWSDGVKPGEEETGVKTRIIGTSAAANKDVANQDQEAEDGPDKELRCLAEQEKVQRPGADASLTRSPNADPAECCSLGLPGTVAVNLPGEPRDDSAQARQLPEEEEEEGEQDELHLHISASEAEKEEKGQFSPFKTYDLPRRRDSSLLDPAEQIVNVLGSSEALREPIEESTVQRPGDLAIQEASAGPLKGTEMLKMNLEGQTSSHQDQGPPVRAASPTARTEPGDPSSLSAKSRRRASEAPEDPGGDEMELDPVSLAGQPAESPSDSAKEDARIVKILSKDHGFIENTSQGLLQDSWPVAGRLPGQPDGATMASPPREAVKKLPGSETSSSPCSGEDEYAQDAGRMHQDIDRVPCQESVCQLGNGPDPSAGYSGGLGCLEPCRALLQEEEELNSSSPRKRHQNEELDLEGDACHQKKLCRQHFVSVPGSASDPASFPVVLPPPPPDLKRSDEQFGKMIVKFLDQCRNQIPLRSDPTQRNGDAIAQIVRSYFKSNIGSNEPATENGKAEELKALSSETAAVKDIGCQPEGGAGDPGESPGCNGPGSPEGEEEGAQIPEDAHVSPGVRSAASGSSTKEEGKGSAGTVQEAYYFQEEPFPLEAGSALEDSSSSSPAEAPNAESTEVPFEEDLCTFSSPDIPPSSQSYKSSPSPYWSHSDKLLGGPSESSGTLSEPEWYSPSDAGGYDEDSDMAVSDDSQALPGDIRPESVRPLSPSEQEAPGQWLQGGEPDGGDRPDGSACREDSGKALEGDRSGMLTEGGVFPHQASPRGSPGQDKMESTPVTSEPFTQSPWESSSKTVLQSGVGHCDPPLKTQLTDEEPDGQDYRGDESPSPSGRTPVASAQESEGPAPAGGSAWLLVKEEPVQEDAPLPCKGDESSLPALCPTQAGDSAGTAVYTGSPLEKEGCRPECGAQQAASYQTSQEAPWIPVTSGGFPAKDDVYVDQGSCRALPLQRDGSRLAQSPLADMELRSQAFEEEKNQLCPHLSYPTSHVPKTSADEQPEGSSHLADFGGREPQFPYKSEEAGLAEPSDAECLRVAAAVSCPAPLAFRERAPLFRDPPAWRGSQSSCLRERAESRSPTEWASSEQDVAFQLQECQSVLAEIFQALSSVEGVDNTHVEKWRDQIAVLQKATKMPQTHIAVVGNTGAGKSCLLNALLDEEAMLPTSAMRACTAVVVEISRAAGGSPYEADVEFLSREEWNKELEALLEDMKDKAGILKKRCPDRKTEAGAAYSRVKAVYGRVDELEKLEDRQGVTQHLGTVKRICAETAADFHMKIEKFIDSRTDNLREMKGGEFWPIVKCVRIRVAKAEVLRTGAVLVDLPGIRDSNAARDTVAREYLKDCNAVWVTASITRAVDDKTARELLSANFRRQLFMDGLYGSLAFICTKTDSFSITDIVRDLSLQDKIRPLEEGLQELEKQKTQAEIEKKHLYAQLQQQEPARKGSAAADSVWLQRHDILEKEFQICSLQREKDAKLRAISLICVQARNEFSKQRILMDFSAGLQEVSRRAEGEDDGEEEVEEGDSAGGQPGKLEVFTVSSTEYLKLGGKLLCNGQPQVFHDVKDTEIPALKKFAMDTALKHSMVATEKVIRDVARVLSQMVNYLNSQRTEADAHQAQVQETLQQALQDLPALLQGVLGASSQDLRQAFEALILGSLQNGAERAKQHSEAIVRGWGSPVCGYPHVTYRAICNHRGVYTSPKYQSVDFNRELSGPILQVISVAWNEVFNSRLVSSIKGFTRALLAQLKSFFKGLKKKLLWHGPVSEALHAICAQQMEATQARLLNFTLDQMSSVTRKQRTISRLLIPTIQAGMEPAYAACSRLSGPGYFQRMKEEMETFIHRQKDALFDSAVEKLWQQLELLQLSIRCSLKTVAQELATSIRMQFEPLLRPVQKNKEILPELQHLCAKVDKICQRSGVDYMLPVALQPEERPPGTEAKLLGNKDHVSLPATSMDVRVGALSLPRLSDIEVSEDHITLTLAGDPTKAALPLRSVSRWECCLPLSCLILHVSAKAAREICFQCRIPMPSPGLGSQEALVIREASQGERQLPKLRHCLAARLSDASWVQELSPEQGREKLVSLGVFYPGQRPESAESAEPRVASTPEPIVLDSAAGQPLQPPVLPWHPHGRKRPWEGVLLQLEKKTRLHSVGPAGYPGLQCSQRAETKPTTHSAALLGSCSPEGTFLPDGPPCPVVKDAEGEPLAVTHSAAGLLWVGVNKGTRGKPPSLTVKEEEAHLPAKKTCFEL